MTKAQKMRLYELRRLQNAGLLRDCDWEELSDLETEAHGEEGKYTIWYKGYLFEGDGDDWNFRECDDLKYAMSIYDNYADDYNKMYITDNVYDVTFYGEYWY